MLPNGEDPQPGQDVPKMVVREGVAAVRGRGRPLHGRGAATETSPSTSTSASPPVGSPAVAAAIARRNSQVVPQVRRPSQHPDPAAAMAALSAAAAGHHQQMIQAQQHQQQLQNQAAISSLASQILGLNPNGMHPLLAAMAAGGAPLGLPPPGGLLPSLPFGHPPSAGLPIPQPFGINGLLGLGVSAPNVQAPMAMHKVAAGATEWNTPPLWKTAIRPHPYKRAPSSSSVSPAGGGPDGGGTGPALPTPSVDANAPSDTSASSSCGTSARSPSPAPPSKWTPDVLAFGGRWAVFNAPQDPAFLFYPPKQTDDTSKLLKTLSPKRSLAACMANGVSEKIKAFREKYSDLFAKVATSFHTLEPMTITKEFIDALVAIVPTAKEAELILAAAEESEESVGENEAFTIQLARVDNWDRKIFCLRYFVNWTHNTREIGKSLPLAESASFLRDSKDLISCFRYVLEAEHTWFGLPLARGQALPRSGRFFRLNELEEFCLRRETSAYRMPFGDGENLYEFMLQWIKDHGPNASILAAVDRVFAHVKALSEVNVAECMERIRNLEAGLRETETEIRTCAFFHEDSSRDTEVWAWMMGTAVDTQIYLKTNMLVAAEEIKKTLDSYGDYVKDPMSIHYKPHEYFAGVGKFLGLLRTLQSGKEYEPTK